MIIPNSKDENSEEKKNNLESAIEILKKQKSRRYEEHTFLDTYQFQYFSSMREFKRETYNRYSYLGKVYENKADKMEADVRLIKKRCKY